MVWSTLLSSLKARGKSARRVPRGRVRGKRTVLSIEMLEERNLLAICSLPPLLMGHVDGIEANFANGQWQMGTWERDTDTHDALSCLSRFPAPERPVPPARNGTSLASGMGARSGFCPSIRTLICFTW